MDIPAGRVQFIAADRADTTVEVRPADATSGRDVKMAAQATVEYADGGLRIEVPAGRRILGSDVRVGRLRGDAEIRTGQGDIQIAEAMGGTVVLRTEAGVISVDAAAGVPAALDAGTTHGRIHNALKNTEGAPGLTIHATTAHGDITARSL